MPISPNAVCFIVGAGSTAPDLQLPLQPDDLLIAADGGLPTVERMGLIPHLIIGDFDSLGHIPTTANTVVLPAEKDVTDMHAAIQLGLERGYSRFALYGGTGGRMDHTLANLQLLDGLARQGCRGFLVGDGTVATALHNSSMDFPPSMSGYLSVFCSGTPCEGVTLRGLKYELSGARLTPDFPLGVSNEFTGLPAHTEVTSGTLLLLWQAGNIENGLLRTL